MISLDALGSRFNTAFLFALLLSFLLALILPRSVAYTPGIIGILAAICLFFQTRKIALPSPGLIPLILGTAFMAGLSTLWAINPDFAMERSIKASLVLLPGILFLGIAGKADISVKNKLIWAFIGIYCLAAAIILIENSLGNPLYRILFNAEPDSNLRTLMNRNTVVLALSYVPVLAFMTRILAGKQKLLIGGAITILAAAALMISNSQTAQLSFLVGAAIFLIFPVRFRTLWAGIGIVTILIALSLPWVVRPLYKTLSDPAAENALLREASIPHRLEIWSFVADKTLESPIYGHGVEATRFMKSDRFMKYPGSNEAMHPHNAILQIWVEFGAIGILFAAAFFSWLLWQGWQLKENSNRRLYLAVLMACVCAASTGYGLWQGWQLGLFFMLAGLSGTAMKKAA